MTERKQIKVRISYNPGVVVIFSKTSTVCEVELELIQLQNERMTPERIVEYFRNLWNELDEEVDFTEEFGLIVSKCGSSVLNSNLVGHRINRLIGT